MSEASGRHAFDLAVSYPGFELAARAAWESPRAALFGASGAGKSTILEALVGVRQEVRGSVRLAGRQLQDRPPEQRHIGWVPQEGCLFPHLDVRRNVEFGARGDAAEVARAIEALEIGPLCELTPSQLSGGQRQRVAIARALASAPSFLVLDEPLASLDRPLRARVLPYLERLSREGGVPYLLVSHDPVEVAALAEQVLVVEGGRIVTDGPASQVLAAASGFGALEALLAENRHRVVVCGRRGGHLELQTTGGTQLSMAAVEGFPEPAGIAVRAEDLLLSSEPLVAVSARNQFGATVAAIQRTPGRVLVALARGPERWTAAVTENAVGELRLEPGRAVHVALKATAVLLDPEPGGCRAR